MTSIRVVHPGADYSVVIGPIEDGMARLAGLAAGRLLPFVSDSRVWALHCHRFAALSDGAPIVVPQGEPAKGWAVLQSIIAGLAERNVPRETPLVALGGGSIGDVAGLAASLFKRGLPIIHVPTTLLAQADSAIGGKTAIDCAGLKNLAGTFHHPALVLADPRFLDTLDGRQMRSGFAELVKYGAIEDPGFFAWCEKNGAAVLAGDAQAQVYAISHAARAKARFVMADPEDRSGTRALLNFGHSFGHAIEALAGGRLLHGEAVAIGMVLAARFSASLGLCAAAEAERIAALLEAHGLPVSLAATGLHGGDVLAAMQGDKKATAAGLKLILIRGVGAAFQAEPVDPQPLAAFITEESARVP